MITIVVPTRNRAFSLRVVAPSYFEQALVDEIIFVSDAGDDDTPELIAEMTQRYPAVRAEVVRNPKRLGASQSRNVGVGHARNDLILFCDDDEYLEPGYARTCLEKLEQLKAGAVSGRRIYMQTGDTPEGAVQRFGTGLRNTKPFRYLLCEMVNGAKFEGDLSVPHTNAVILTRRELLVKYPFDGHYARGNGYREETDYQMNLFVHDYPIYITNDVHSIHLPLSQVRSGGQRTQPFKKIYWSMFLHQLLFQEVLPGLRPARRASRTPVVCNAGFRGVRGLSRDLASAALCIGHAGAGAAPRAAISPKNRVAYAIVRNPYG